MTSDKEVRVVSEMTEGKKVMEAVIVSDKVKRETHEMIWQRLMQMPLYGD